MLRINYIFRLVLLFSIPVQLLAQGGTQVKFGKNRVQYHDDFQEWSQYESDNFFVYYYGKSRTAAQKVVQMAEYDFDEIQTLLEHRMNEKLQIIVYSDVTDVKQSNIGSEELFVNANGQTKVSGNTIFVYFDGNHRNLRAQVREGIAAVYLNTMLFGANIQEIVQNAVLLNLPNWFKEGLVAYAGEAWNVEQDNQLRNILMSRKYKKFERFADDFPRLAGQSMWYFISEKYGRPSVSSLLYLTRINRSVESGFLYVLDQSFQATTKEWDAFFRARYESDLKGRQIPQADQLITFRKRDRLPVTQLKLSPDGTRLAYVLNDQGRTKIYLYDLQQKKKKRIFKEGFRNALQSTDYNYPLIAWSPSGQQLAILYERRDNLKLSTYDISKDKTTTELFSEQYQRVYSLDYLDNFNLLLSAEVSGQSDIFTYAVRTRQSTRITNDIYDDLDAVAVKVRNRRGIVFSSNRESIFFKTARPDSILPIGTFDLFYYDLQSPIREFVRVTHTPLANERLPLAIDTTYFSYISDRDGIHNRESARLEDYIREYRQHVYLKDGTELNWPMDSTMRSLDSTQIDSVRVLPEIRQRSITQSQTDYPFHLTMHHVAANSNKMVETFAALGRRTFYISKHDPAQVRQGAGTFFRRKELQNLSTQAQRDSVLLHSLPALNANLPAPPLPTKLDTLPKQEVKVLITPPGPLAVDTLPKVEADEPYLFQSEFSLPNPVKQTNKVVESPKEQTPELQREYTTPETYKPTASKTPELPKSLETPKPLNSETSASFPLFNTQKKLYMLSPTKAIPYRLQFRSDFMTTQVDNSLLFEGMESIAANPDGFQPPPPGMLLKANVKDLFEDYEFEGGIRVPTSFNGTEYYLTFNNRKKRLDKFYSIYTRNTRLNRDSRSTPIRDEYNILMGQFGVRYPLDVFRRIQATGTLRRDRTTRLLTDINSQIDQRNPLDQADQRIGLRLEYVFDNTVDLAVNLRRGTRYRFFVEMQKKFSVNNESGLDVNFNKGFMTVLNMDVRHYQRVLRLSVLAARLTGGTSFGSERVLYFLGGMDQWLFPQQNNDIPVPRGNFAFQTLVANLRGFPINIRNGNSFALLNTELRVPLIRYISRRVQSPLLKNFQVIGFFDMGTAWEGFSPYRDDNPINTTRFNSGPFITTTVNYFRDPLVAGYGIGARTTLFGYFLRADYAWGIDTRRVQKPKLYLSLGMDF
jgi:Tol biopolymer transport system component